MPEFSPVRGGGSWYLKQTVYLLYTIAMCTLSLLVAARLEPFMIIIPLYGRYPFSYTIPPLMLRGTFTIGPLWW